MFKLKNIKSYSASLYIIVGNHYYHFLFFFFLAHAYKQLLLSVHKQLNKLPSSMNAAAAAVMEFAPPSPPLTVVVFARLVFPSLFVIRGDGRV